ncbi:MAG: catalase family peroxidase [Pseudomonas sp.]|uniref:catalase family peroxidase n=1 Tax=Pseudomonas sp. TaxID=306 RepID=UPI0033986E09
MNRLWLHRSMAGVLLAGTLSAPAAFAATENPSTAASKHAMSQDPLHDALLDALYATFGHHPGFRVTHAKGVLVRGTFTASHAAAALTRAAHLQGSVVPVLLRFSNFSGVPATADGDPMASPHGLALRFTLPDGASTDIVAHSFNGFPVATPEDFLRFLQGIAANVAVPSDPLPLQAFLADHPRAQQFLETPKPAPRSYASAEYFGVNALVFSDRQGTDRVGRYRIEPLLAEPALSDEQAASMPADYLQDDIGARLTQGAVKLRLLVQLAAPGDAIEDGSIPWSRSHQEIELGILTLDARMPAEEQALAQKRLAFSPGRLLDGIKPSRDPMIQARDAIYQRAVLRRQQP